MNDPICRKILRWAEKWGEEQDINQGDFAKQAMEAPHKSIEDYQFD